MNVRAQRFPLMDSLRAIAALSLVVYHSAFFAGVYNPDSTLGPYVVQLGAIGVTVFFVISGFLLYRPFARARLEGQPWPSTGAYAWRRFLRIVPAFWVAITIVTIWLGSDIWSPRGVVSNYGFLQLYMGGGARDAIPQGWTLCVEVAFYTLLPVWAWLMRRVPAREARGRLRVEVVALLAAMVASLGYSAVAVSEGASSAVLAALPGWMFHFGLGMLLAVASVWIEGARRGALPRPFAVVAEHAWLCWLAAAAALWLSASQIGLTGVIGGEYTLGHYMARQLLNGVIAVGLVLPAVFGDPRRGLVRRVLANPVLLYLGLISYSVYLYHWAVIQQLSRWELDELGFLPAYPRWLLFTLVGTVVIASLSYYLVERPALSLKRLVGPPPEREQPGEELAEPAPATTIGRS